MLGFEFDALSPVERGLIATAISAMALALLYFIYRIWSSPRTPAFIWLIIVLVVAAVVWLVTFIVLGICCSALDREPFFPAAPVSVTPRYICSGDPVTVAWQPDLSLCNAGNCSEGSCPGDLTSECPEPSIQTCIDKSCRWVFGAPTPGDNPCTSGCPIPTTMTITAEPATAVSTDPVVDGNLNFTDSVVITPSADVSLSIDPDGPNRFRYRTSTKQVSVIGANAFITVQAHLECNPDRANPDDPKWKLKLDEGAAADGVIITSIANGSTGRGFRFILPGGGGNTFERDIGPGATVSGIGATDNIGEDTYANDNPLRVGDSECAAPDPGTTSPGTTPAVEPPQLPIELTLTCLR